MVSEFRLDNLSGMKEAYDARNTRGTFAAGA